MTREYDIKNAAWDYFQDLDSHHFQILPHCNPQTDAFEAGAKWADETMIDKVCEWLDKVDTDDYMDSGYIPKKKVFRESSNFGVWESEITFIERR